MVMLSPMAETFEGSTIFITGASGFVGKVLIEKLLRSLPGITTIFVLIRPLKGKRCVFNQVRRNFPVRLGKVVVVEGDIAEDEFGLSKEDKERVLAETSVVFHCAATVRFDERLKKAADLNVSGVRRMIDLCHRMPKLESFLHCSTTYVNADKPGEKNAEKLCKSEIDVHKLNTALENLTAEQCDILCDDLVHGYPNTYTFTKMLGEQIVELDAVDLPVVIFRPSIISPIWKDGIPGWADCFQGLTAMIGAMYTGAIPRFPMNIVNPKKILDCVPVDVVVSMMIVCAGQRMSFHSDSIPVYHCCTSDLNPLNLQIFADIGQKYAMRYPAERFLSSPSFALRGFQSIESCRHKLRSEWAGPAMDGFGCVLRHRPFWAKLYSRMRSAYETLIPFAQMFHFETIGMSKLTDAMTAEDRETFNFDVRKIDWNAYGCDLMMGMKTFLLKDDITDARRMRAARLNLMSHQLLGVLPLIAFCYFIISGVTGDWADWPILLPLMVVLILLIMKDWISFTRIKPIDQYRDEVESIMGEPLRSKKVEKQIV